MSDPARRKPSYADILALPEHLVGEILGGELHTHPRPAPRHARAYSALGGSLWNPFDAGKGGPGGWWIIDEPEIHFALDTEVTVPDIAGWRRERMPSPPEGHKIEVVPDWICEIFSPATKSTDREEKMPLYARYGVRFAWLVDPKTQTLEAYELVDANWRPLGMFRDDDMVSVAPFEEIVIRLVDLWG